MALFRVQKFIGDRLVEQDVFPFEIPPVTGFRQSAQRWFELGYPGAWVRVDVAYEAQGPVLLFVVREATSMTVLERGLSAALPPP